MVILVVLPFLFWFIYYAIKMYQGMGGMLYFALPPKEDKVRVCIDTKPPPGKLLFSYRVRGYYWTQDIERALGQFRINGDFYDKDAALAYMDHLQRKWHVVPNVSK
jgi:hypothetical protein